ncbi:MAG: thioredoxin domain-containing protein [Deltaproteobacteria bacterium]|nr:thioredoxin domain-containing protein [Deltaproteobacteria bacterium]
MSDPIDTRNAGGLASQPTRGWRIAFLVLCTVGLCLSADLARLHLKVHTDPDYHAYCAMSERVNCETVATSDWAVTLGLPTAIWGILVYLSLGALAVWGLFTRPRSRSWPFALLCLLTLGASAYSVALLLISHLIIGSVCLVCVGTYLVNFALLFTAVAEVRRLGRPIREAVCEELVAAIREPAAVIGLVGLLLAAASVTRLVIPTYWSMVSGFGPGGLAIGATPEGAHWIGAVKPTLTIEEFSDYQCPHCLRGHEQLRKLLAQSGDKIRLVHRHYPLDQQCNPALDKPFHAAACAYSRLAHCAGAQGRFWEANDYLFANGHRRDPVTAAELAEALNLEPKELSGCVADPKTAAVVARDLAAGRALKIRGTPTFVIGDQTYPGGIPTEVIAARLGAAREPPKGNDCSPSEPRPGDSGACASPASDAPPQAYPPVPP